MLIMLIYLLDGSIHTIKKNTDALVVASKEIGLELNAHVTKDMFMSRSECRTKSQYKDR
jgi:hypothetical protein